MYRNAKAEMVRAGLILSDVAESLGGTEAKWSQKLNGKTPITVEEAKRFKKLVKSELPIDELFRQFPEAS